MTGMLSRFCKSALMVRKWAHGTREKLAWTQSILFVSLGEFDTRSMTFEIANGPCLEYLKKELDYSGCSTFFGKLGIPRNVWSPFDASDVVNDVEDSGNWDLEGGIALNEKGRGG